MTAQSRYNRVANRQSIVKVSDMEEMKPTLVVLAAGMGSRYGALKQVDPVGPSGEAILDYSVFDAQRAGFGRVVFVIRKDFEAEFRERVGSKYENAIDVDYCFQDIADIPPPFAAPAERAKPWGTAHAIRAARGAVKTPFMAINADDFYGRAAYEALARFLTSPDAAGTGAKAHFAMAGYRLGNTLSENGPVARGACEIDAGGFLTDVRELTKLVRAGDMAENREEGGPVETLPLDTRVSMNCWGFAPALFDELEKRFPAWLAANASSAKAEWYIPFAIDEMVKDGAADVKVLGVESRWFGMTYREDKPAVAGAIRALVAAGEYPENLRER